MINETHSQALQSWVESANDPKSDFPVQNLPFGAFTRKGGAERRLGVAIGDRILDLAAAANAGLLAGLAPAIFAACRAVQLNPLLALGPVHWSALRRTIAQILRRDGEAAATARQNADALLVPQSAVEMAVPMEIGDYTDFFASRHHAHNAGQIMGRADPLLPNYRYVPIAYHGRSSSVVISGTPVRRPMGQTKPKDAPAPVFGPSRRLDYELEVATIIGPGNALGTQIPLAQAESHVFGLCLQNDWSARDIQVWEAQPLGPFLGKSFATTISPWIVTLEALEPFRVARAARPQGDAEPLPHLDSPEDRAQGAIDLVVEAWIETGTMREARQGPVRLSRGRYRDLYWTIFQMVAHHTTNGCNLRPGDMIGSGTVSGPERDQVGCLLEKSWGGTEPFKLPNGESRTFLEDGDRVIFRGACERDGYRRIGFGECAGTITPAG